MTEQTTPTLEPVVVHQHQGEARWWFEGLAVIRVTAADTGGQMTSVEMTEAPWPSGTATRPSPRG